MSLSVTLHTILLIRLELVVLTYSKVRQTYGSLGNTKKGAGRPLSGCHRVVVSNRPPSGPIDVQCLAMEGHSDTCRSRLVRELSERQTAATARQAS